MAFEKKRMRFKRQGLSSKGRLFMQPEFGITRKLIVWFMLVFITFSATLGVLFLNVRAVARVSGAIVSKNYTIASAIKKMTEALLEMETHQKKYILLNTPNYLHYYNESRHIFENNLEQVIRLAGGGHEIAGEWHAIHDAYMAMKTQNPDPANTFWIPDAQINSWIETLSTMEKINGVEIEQSTQALNRKGHLFLRNGLIGIFLSCLVGGVGLIHLARSMIRPLRELMGGIRSLSSNQKHHPLKIHGHDELGELTKAFNEMSHRLHQEEHMRSDFISMLSHEIRTPLTSIRESVNMIREEVTGPITQRQRRLLEIAGSEIVRISDLLAHLMQASRLEPKPLVAPLDPIDPHLLIMESVNRIRPAAEAKHICLSVEIPHQVPAIAGDYSQLQQALLNYLSNAVKFSEPDTCVTVGVRYHPPETKTDFFVQDQGPGILEEEQTFLFNKYYRGQRERDRLEGAGLGLSIVKNIVESHHGSVWLESDVGKGSLFGFTIPCVDEPQSIILDENG